MYDAARRWSFIITAPPRPVFLFVSSVLGLLAASVTLLLASGPPQAQARLDYGLPPDGPSWYSFAARGLSSPTSTLGAPTPTQDPPPLPTFTTSTPVATSTTPFPTASPTIAPTLTITPTITPPTPTPIAYYPPSFIAQLPQVPLTQTVVSPLVGGGVASGAVQLTFPTGVYSASLHVDLLKETTYPVLPPIEHPHLFFTVNLTDQGSGAPVHLVAQPVEMRINLAALPAAVLAFPYLNLWHFDDSRGVWEIVGSQRVGDELVAQVRQFSFYGLSGTYGPDWFPSKLMDIAQTNLSSGSAGFSIPLDVPKGTNGMEPRLVLTYSSLAHDEMNHFIGTAKEGARDNQGPSTRANWVGLGWSLSLGRINSVVTESCGDTEDRCKPPSYSIELNGIREELICTGGDCDDQDGNGSSASHTYKTIKQHSIRKRVGWSLSG